MAITKQEILKIIQDLPDDVSIEDAIAELSFRAKVEEGLEQLDRGEWISHEEVEKRVFSKWLSD